MSRLVLDEARCCLYRNCSSTSEQCCNIQAALSSTLPDAVGKSARTCENSPPLRLPSSNLVKKTNALQLHTRLYGAPCDKRKSTTVMIRIYTVSRVAACFNSLHRQTHWPASQILLGRFVHFEVPFQKSSNFVRCRASLILLDVRVGQDALGFEPPAGLLESPCLDAVTGQP